MQELDDRRPLILAATLVAMLGACGSQPEPTVEEAQAFIESAETRLLERWMEVGQASWVQNNFITDDTNAIAAAARTKPNTKRPATS